MNYYNENDPKAAAWLRSLIEAGLIPYGTVDERSICDVQGHELKGYKQVHLFAGIAGWSRALQLASWPTDVPVWTGSCPCQPFSQAGKGKGEKDARHLWPEMRRLIDECRPPICFGEQVASKAGREWLSRVRAEMEALGYGVGASDLCAASVGAPHIRQRLWWVVQSNGSGWGQGRSSAQTTRHGSSAESASRTRDGLGNSRSQGPQKRIGNGRAERSPIKSSTWEAFVLASCRDGKARRIKPGIVPLVNGIPGRVAQLRGLGNAIVPQVAAEFIGAFLDVARGNT